MNWFKRNNRNNSTFSGVFVTKTDLSVVASVDTTMPLIVAGKTGKGPINEPIKIYPKTAFVKWYQFWRHSDREKYNEEVAECMEKFHKIFGA